MASNRLPQREALTKENANLEVGRTGSYKPYNSSLAAYAAVNASKAHQLRMEAQDAASAVEGAQSEPGSVMSLNDIRRLGNLRSAADRRKARANMAEKEASNHAKQARIEEEKRLAREKKNPEEEATRLSQLVEASYASMKEEVRAKDEAVRSRAEAARRARYDSYAAAERAAANARIAAAGQAALARVQAELAQEEAARRARQGGKGSYRKKRTIRSKRNINRKTQRNRK
jgi:hypothetical protein